MLLSSVRTTDNGSTDEVQLIYVLALDTRNLFVAAIIAIDSTGTPIIMILFLGLIYRQYQR